MLRVFATTLSVGAATTSFACGLATAGLLDATGGNGDGGPGSLMFNDDAQPANPSDGKSPSEDSAGPSLDGQSALGPAPIWDGSAIGAPPFLDADWVRFCVALAACGQVPSVSACVARLPQPLSPSELIPPSYLVANVIGAAPACPTVAAALGDGSRCSTATPDTCTGNSLVTCRWGLKMTIECGMLGMLCSTSAGAGCGFGDCAPSQEGSAYCVGPDHLVECRNGRYVLAYDCQTFGATCVGAPGSARCRGASGAACTSAPSCVGTSIDVCLDGQRGSAGCPGLYDPSFACLLADAGVPVCSGGAACASASYADSCGAMGVLDFCNVGAVGHFGCRAGGYRGCSSGACTP